MKNIKIQSMQNQRTTIIIHDSLNNPYKKLFTMSIVLKPT